MRINGEVVNSIDHIVTLSQEKGTIVQSGKKKFSLVFAK